MPVSRYYLNNRTSGHLAAWGTAPPAPWTRSAAINVNELSTSPGTTANGSTVAQGDTVEIRRGRTESFVTPALATAQTVSGVRAAIRCEHWLTGSKALALRVRHIAADSLAGTVNEPPGVDVVAFATSGQTTSNGYRVYTIDVTLSTPVLVPAGRRLQIDIGGEIQPGQSGQGFYVFVGETGADLPFSHGSTANGRGWVEVAYADPPPPESPVNLTLTEATSDSLTITWEPSPTGPTPTGYRVQLQPPEAVYVDVGDTLTHTWTGLEPNALYSATVWAYNAYGDASTTIEGLVTLEDTGPRPAPAPGIASQAVLYAAGLNPSPSGPHAPAQQWWDVDRLDVEHYNPARSAGLVSYSIGYGSRDPLGRPGALGVSVAVVVPVGESIGIGDRFKLRLSAALADALGLTPDAAVRMTGIVTDAAADPVRSWDLPGYGPAILWAVTATGWLSRFGAAPLDGTAWPTEPVGDRIRRILDSLALTGDVDLVGPAVRPMAAPGSHHGALAAATDSTLGRLVEQPSGLVDYHDPGDRRGTLPALSLDAAEILGDGFSWRQSVGDVVNSAEISYGPTGAKVSVTDVVSADPRSGIGPYPASISTVLDAEADAYSLGADLVGRRAWPFYQLPAVAVDLARSGLDVERVAALFEVAVGDRVAMSSMPPGSPWDSISRGCFIEGYTETATAYAWRLSLVVSDPAMSGVSLRYVDVTNGARYVDVDPSLSYLDVSRIEDPADLL